MTVTSCSGSCFRDHSAVVLAGTESESALVSLQEVHQQQMRRHRVTDSTNQSESSSVSIEHDRSVPWVSQLPICQAQRSHQFVLMCDRHPDHDHDHRVRSHVRVQNLDHDHDHRDCCRDSCCSQNLVVVQPGFHRIVCPKQLHAVTVRAAVLHKHVVASLPQAVEQACCLASRGFECVPPCPCALGGQH